MTTVGYGKQIVHAIGVIAGRRTLVVSSDGDVGPVGGGRSRGCRGAGGSEMKR